MHSLRLPLKHFFFCLFLLAFVFFCSAFNESDYLKDIQAYLRIKDFQSAVDESVEALHIFPHSQPLWNIYIKALSKQGQEKEMISAWKDYVDVFPEERKSRELTETVAWGIIDKASVSTSPLIRIMALLSAYLSQDSRGIEIIHGKLQDSNSAIRGLAVQLSAHLYDDDLKDEVYNLFQKETVWNVRLEAIRSMGGMKLKKAQSELIALLQHTKTTAEETVAIIEALVEMWDSASRPEVAKLTSSNRAGLRLLACQVIGHFDMKADIDLITPLLDDHNAEVRKAALWLLGYLRIKQLGDESVVALAKGKLEDKDPLVAIKAAWVLTLNDPTQGQEAFNTYLKHPNRDVQIMAAAHLASCGKYAFPLIVEHFNTSIDPYIRMNLALGLLGQNSEIQSACQALYEGLQKVNERWTWDEENDVKALIPSKLRFMDDLNNSPETVNQITRLEILNILAIMKFSKAQQAIKSFLQQKTWGITAMAAATLLTEGDEAALELVQNLMNDSDMRVRIQAALIFALWGGGDTALDTLSKAYPKVDREMKEHILEGIVKIASPTSIPFLLDRLQEPNQSLRVMAAIGLILSLYR